ncbi:ribosome-binding factor A [Rhizobiales bacterium GAS188]|nr:ribosome-binding factor A [Rhizobiales bacterium GAS188]
MAKHQSAKARRGPSQRSLRVGELVRHALADMLSRGEVRDDVLESHVITIPEVRMSPDMRLATAYVMPLGGKDVAPVLEALERNRRFIKGEIAHRINLRYAPDIRFRRDQTFEEASRIDALLHSDRVRRDLEKAREEDRDEDPAANQDPAPKEDND